MGKLTFCFDVVEQLLAVTLVRHWETFLGCGGGAGGLVTAGAGAGCSICGRHWTTVNSRV